MPLHVPTDPTAGSRFFRPLSGRWLVVFLLAGLALRLLFVFRWPIITPDGVVYADIAKHWLRGVYGLTDGAGVAPTYIRLPGYPAFLAAIFAVAGFDHFDAVRFMQVAVDLLTCFVVADLARRVLSPAAGRVAFVLYALCPFVANYVAVPLTETLAIFCAAAALDCLVIALDALPSHPLRPAILCGLATAFGILLRRDGGIVLMTIGAYVLYRALREGPWLAHLRIGFIVAAVGLAPLIPWAWRNWHTFRVFQPLVPVAANDPGEFVAVGFERWEHTWEIDYAALVDCGFKVDGEEVGVDDLPSNALGSGEERDRTIQLFADYNDSLAMTPELDRRFAELARERVARSPLRYYVVLPALRAADLWLRPRTELLPVSAHFWDLDEGWRDFTVSTLSILLNVALIFFAIRGLRRSPPRHLALLVGFIVLRTAIITAIAGPEPRYVLECVPFMLVFAAGALLPPRTGVPAPRERAPAA